MYIYRYTHTHKNMFLHVNSKKEMFYQSWKETICVLTLTYFAQSDIFTMPSWGFFFSGCPVSAHFYRVTSTTDFGPVFFPSSFRLICLKRLNNYGYIVICYEGHNGISGVWTVYPIWCVLPLSGKECVRKCLSRMCFFL